MVRNWTFALIAGLVSAFQPAAAATYYVAPIGASFPGTPNGSIDHPFTSTDTAFSSGKIVGGDTLLLMDGSFGMLRVQASYTTPVTIKSQNNRNAQVDSIYVLNSGRNVIFQNLKVWPNNSATRQRTLVTTTSSTSNIQFISLDIRSRRDAYNYINWTAADWANFASSGVMIDGSNSLVRQSNFTGVYFGIVLSGADNLVAGNTIDGFSGDGLRGNGPRGVFRDNIVQNCANFDGNHADGFQSFSNGSIPGLVIERNTFVEWKHNPTHPLRCEMQGIGMFDGEYTNLTIINNVIAVGNGHGLTVNGAHGARIINNTVLNIDGIQPGYPWIGVYPARNGNVPTDVIVANNAAMGYAGATNKANGVLFTHNRTIRNVNWAMPGWRTFNYVPRAEIRWKDAADPAYAPALDVLRHSRPEGEGPDIGAYEINNVAGAEALSDTVLQPPPLISAASDAAEAQAAPATTGKTTTGGAKFLPAP
jgi:hypothetical protein